MPSGGRMHAVELVGVSKLYGRVPAVQGVSLDVREGELLALLGPSGCGKTTLLRMIAGFVEPTSGEVRIRGRDVAGVPPYRRDTAMVFQSYALFPHLTVGQNIRFGLTMRGTSRDDAERRVGEALGLVAMDGFGGRYPGELSGGQQQRVALARALVVRPAVLLLDEPLSNLDARLRQETRREIRRLQQRLGLAAVFVTHDQEEALAIADRVAVFSGGHLEEIATPVELYERPRSRFAADFIGHTNLLRGVVEPASPDRRGRGGSDGVTVNFRTEDGLLFGLRRPGVPIGPGEAAVRAAKLRLSTPTSAEGSADDDWAGTQAVDRPSLRAIGTIDGVDYLGATSHYAVRVGAATLLVEDVNADGPAWRPGQAVAVECDEASLTWLGDSAHAATSGSAPASGQDTTRQGTTREDALRQDAAGHGAGGFRTAGESAQNPAVSDTTGKDSALAADRLAVDRQRRET